MGNPPLDKEVSVVVEPTENNRAASDTESQVIEPAWEPGVWKQFPWIALAGLTTVVVCSISALFVLRTSNNRPASEWLNGRLAPNVVLTILNNVSSLAITLAVGQGIAISWWRRALSGATVKQLHHSWTFSTSLMDIFTKAKYFNVIALAALMAKIAVIDGVLFQRATYTYLDIIRGTKHNETIHPFGATVFPVSANMGSSLDRHGLMTYDFESQVIHWDATQEDIDQNILIEGCNGADCHYYMHGLGFSMSCTNTTTAIDYGNVARSLSVRVGNNSQLTVGNSSQLTDLPLFSVNFTRTWPSATKNYSALVLEMHHAQLPDEASFPSGGVCPMDYIQTTCELRPAILNYKVQYSNGSKVALSHQKHEVPGIKPPPSPITPYDPNLRLQAKANESPSGTRLDYNCPDGSDKTVFFDACKSYDPKWKQVVGIEVVKNVDIVENFVPFAQSQLEGFYLAFRTNLEAQGSLSRVNNTWLLDSDGMLAIMNRNADPTPGSCNYSYTDPLSDVMASVNTMTFMAAQNQYLFYEWSDKLEDVDYTRPIGGISASDASNQTVTTIVHYEDVFYASDDRYMYGALAATFFVLLCVLPVFWGFWELGRKVTLGPIEIANAFQGPAFTGVRGDHVDEVIKSVGKQRLTYGHIEHEEGRRLGFRAA